MKRNILFTFLLCIFLCSCVSTQTIFIDIKQPASITLPTQIDNLTLIDNAAVSTLEPTSDMLKTGIQFVSFDSIKIAFVENLYTKISEKNFFGDVQVYPYEMRTDSAYFQERLLTKEQISDLSEETSADALLSLDNFGLISSSRLVNGYNEIALCIQAKLRLFSPNGDLFAVPIFLNDTLYWSEVDYSSGFPIIKGLPTLPEALKEINDHATDLIVKQFVPFWISTVRIYFPDRATSMMIKKNNWEDVRAFWINIFNNEKKTKKIKRARLAYNIALTYEYTDNIEEANKWISKACTILPSSASQNIAELFESYKVALYERLRSKEILKKQLGE